jgi:hypothetical protein
MYLIGAALAIVDEVATTTTNPIPPSPLLYPLSFYPSSGTDYIVLALVIRRPGATRMMMGS